MNSKILQNKGAALLMFVVFFLAASLILVLTIGRGVYDDLLTYRVLESGKKSFYAAESGIEDAVYRHVQGYEYDDAETFDVFGVPVSMTRTSVAGAYDIVAEGASYNAFRKSHILLEVGNGVSFSFGMQSGNGGIRFLQSSSVVGNVFSNGIIEGSGNFVYGDAISAEATGLVDDIHATGTVWSHTIKDSIIDKDAHYFSAATKIATVVGMVSYPGSADQASTSYPITIPQIDGWKTLITTTGTVIASTSPECSSGTYTIDSDTALGNVRIECDVILKKTGATPVITLTGGVWIEGNLEIKGVSVVASSSLAQKSVQIIADKVSDHLTSSKVSITTASNFSSGNARSYILIVSMNNSAELGGSEIAINLAQTGTGKFVVFAPYGLIDIAQSSSLKEITGYQIVLRNTTQVIYESGLTNLIFDSAVGGGYILSNWKETI